MHCRESCQQSSRTPAEVGAHISGTLGPGRGGRKGRGGEREGGGEGGEVMGFAKGLGSIWEVRQHHILSRYTLPG